MNFQGMNRLENKNYPLKIDYLNNKSEKNLKIVTEGANMLIIRVNTIFSIITESYSALSFLVTRGKKTS